MFFDFETYLDDNKKHIDNLAISHYFNGDEVIHRNIDEFCTWVFATKHRGYIFIAHKGKGYDFQFILEWLVANKIKPKLISVDEKIMPMSLKNGYNIRFFDSLCFTMQPLRNFPTTFGIYELAKGYFPHEFNRPINYDYVGK